MRGRVLKQCTEVIQEVENAEHSVQTVRLQLARTKGFFL